MKGRFFIARGVSAIAKAPTWSLKAPFIDLFQTPNTFLNDSKNLFEAIPGELGNK